MILLGFCSENDRVIQKTGANAATHLSYSVMTPKDSLQMCDIELRSEGTMIETCTERDREREKEEDRRKQEETGRCRRSTQRGREGGGENEEHRTLQKNDAEGERENPRPATRPSRDCERDSPCWLRETEGSDNQDCCWGSSS